MEGASGETTEPLTKIVWLHSLWCTFPTATGTESTFDSDFVPGEQAAISPRKTSATKNVFIFMIILLANHLLAFDQTDAAMSRELTSPSPGGNSAAVVSTHTE